MAPRVPLRENFSPFETTLAFAAAGFGTYLLAAGDTMFDPPRPGMGPPDPDSLDARLSRMAYTGDHTMWWGVPYVTGGYLLPAVPALIYTADWLALDLRGAPLVFQGDRNPSHRLVAFVETMGWTYLLTGLVKYTAGRPRPYTEGANNHPALRRKPSEDNLSFFSGHASISFAAGVFLAEDISRYLLRAPLADDGPTTRLLLGRVLPNLLGYGVPSIIAISRVIEQQHWPSDTLTGAISGALIAHLVYAVHFDHDGNPQRRHKPGAGYLTPVVGKDRDGIRRVLLSYRFDLGGLGKLGNVSNVRR